jgi:hypothetical protein
MSNNAINHPEIPLQNIALTFSGGGFRAAAFSLGALTYLSSIEWPGAEASQNDKSLLGNVSYIASTSGGSFTNALYSAYIHHGKTMKDVYVKLKKEMSGQGMLLAVFNELENASAWQQQGNEKNKNFINAFSKVYDKMLFDGETFGVFWNKANTASFEVCFNCTEFYRGLSFRFQTEGNNNPKQVVGNKYLHFDNNELATLKKIKIADMVAASSCFPAGFEPLVYPQDFSYASSEKSLSVAELNKALLFEDYQEKISPVSTPYGFMDGGITDNQGLYSAKRADKRRRERTEPHPFDLFIITDVASYFMDEYKVPEVKSVPEWRSNNILHYINLAKKGIKKFAGTVKWSGIISILLLLASVAGFLFSENEILQIGAGFFTGISVLILLIILLLKNISGFKWLLTNKKKLLDDSFINDYTKSHSFVSEKLMIRLIHFLKISKLGLLEQMVKARMASMLSMLLDINLKQTRRLIYEMFYNDATWENRRMPNFIYELSTYNSVARKNRFNNPTRLKWNATDADKQLFLTGYDEINKVAEDARTMGTTLWFDEKDERDQRLKKIIAAGQFTTCCNLLEYLISIERKGIHFNEAVTSKLKQIKAKLTTDLGLFKTDPFFMYDLLEK